MTRPCASRLGVVIPKENPLQSCHYCCESINSNVIEQKNENGGWKNWKFKNKMKSETLTIDNIMLNGESKDLSKIRTCNSNSSYTNGERLKVIHFYSFLFSFLRRTKSGKSYPTRLSTSIKSLETTCTACTATLHFFKRAYWGYICKHNL